MSDISENIFRLRAAIPPSVKIIAVSKTKPPEDILVAFSTGQRIFGENRVQEILRKKAQLPADIEWHLIGHLQTNKVKSIVPVVSMIQSIDSFRLLNAVNFESEKAGRITDCLLQIHIAEEETKTGFSIDELLETPGNLRELKNVRICGLMGMATFTMDNNQVRKEFRYLAKCFKDLKDSIFGENEYFKELSMGMSGDYRIAVEEGSTMIRVGSLIFGERNKNQQDND